eukprot:SAG11_NODE_5563_length_1523_cov_1.122191_2_plen_85_part_00
MLGETLRSSTTAADGEPAAAAFFQSLAENLLPSVVPTLGGAFARADESVGTVGARERLWHISRAIDGLELQRDSISVRPTLHRS